MDFFNFICVLLFACVLAVEGSNPGSNGIDIVDIIKAGLKDLPESIGIVV
jgi:hypothetical protein